MTPFAQSWLGFKGSNIHSVPEIQSLIDDEDVWLPGCRVSPHSCNSGNGNILYGLVLFTAVRVDGDLTTFVRDKQSVATCNISIRMRIIFSTCIIVMIPRGF
jgi:hypothetical protein